MKQVWETYHPKLQVYLNQMGFRGDEVLDLVSELLLHIFENLHKYNSSFAFSTWLYTITRNRMIDQGRKRRFLWDEWEEHHSVEGETPESEMMREEEKNMVQQALNQLNDVDRELVYLHFYEELKYKEISGILNMPEGTIKYRMSEIRKNMKNELSRSYSL